MASPPDPSPRPRGASDSVLIAAGIAALWIVAAAGIGIYHEFSAERRRDAAQLQAIAGFKATQIADRLAERRADGEFVRTSSFFAAQYRRWRDARDAHALEILANRLKDFRQGPGLAAISLLDADGRRLWHSPGAPGTAPGLSSVLQQAAAAGAVRIAGPYRDASGIGHLDVVAPLVQAGPAPPFIVLNIGLEAWLFDSLQSLPVPMRTGEILLARREGRSVVFLNGLPAAGRGAPASRFAADDQDLLAARILRGETQEGRFAAGLDWRGEAVFGAFHAVPGTDWLLIAKMDDSELYADATRGAAWIAALGLLALLATAAGAHLVRQRQQLTVASELQSAQTERLQAQARAKQALHRQAEELRSRNAELERFNRAMVGRELDMIALKQQINELSRQLQKEPPFELGFAAGTAGDPREIDARCR